MPFEYNIDYWDKMIRQNSPTAKQISKVRWNFVRPAKAKRVLDFGSGPGFFRAFRPVGIEVDTFDINPYPQTGILHEVYDLITFWDVMEHFEDLEEFFKKIDASGAKYVALTIPVMKEGLDLMSWKHYKPGEHFHYFSEEELIKVFKDKNFRVVRSGFPECPPREDILSVLLKKNG